jgi:acetylornithine deacetylase/succinyl-diaminopimelate desuccinylase-like protein
MRMPRGSRKLRDKIAKRINARRGHVTVEIDHEQGNGWRATRKRVAVDLLNIFGDTTGREAAVPTAGSTTAKLLPNAINFGPAMPGKKYTAHNANEYKEVSDLDPDMQMFTEMLVRIGNLDRMQ